METVKGDNCPPKTSFLCYWKGSALGYKDRMELGVLEDLNPRTETHWLDDLEQILFHISVSVSSSATWV